jgi:hypothetical protein
MEKDREIQAKHDKGARPQVQRTVEGEEEPVQAKSAEEEEPIQAMEEEEPIQTMEEEEPVQAMEEEEPLQAKSKAVNNAAPNLANRLRSRAGKGRPLEGQTREKMESGFARDFSDVNVHTDATADEMNRELGARAFARGKDVYFKSGEYNPDTAAGQRLIAHELTHTVQQGGGEAKGMVPPLLQRNPVSDAASRAVNYVGDKVREVVEAVSGLVPENKYEALPGFDKMWNAFPKGTAAEVKKAIGGKVNYDWITNTCAIRMSRVLNYTGHDVPKTTVKKGEKTNYLTVTGADKKWYYYRISNLRPFVEKKFGPPDHTFKPPYDMKALSKHKGIILFDVDVWDDATGHYTLWDGKSCADKCFFKEASAVHLWTK